MVATTAAPLGGAAQGVPPRERQDTTSVLGRVRVAQQRVWQNRMDGGRDDGEGAQVTWPHLSSSSLSGEGKRLDTEGNTEGQFRAGRSMVTRDEQEMMLVKDATRAPSDLGSDSQVQYNSRTQGAGSEEDGTIAE